MAKFEGQEIPSWKELGIDPGESQLLEWFFPMISPLDDRHHDDKQNCFSELEVFCPPSVRTCQLSSMIQIKSSSIQIYSTHHFSIQFFISYRVQYLVLLYSLHHCCSSIVRNSPWLVNKRRTMVQRLSASSMALVAFVSTMARLPACTMGFQHQMIQTGRRTMAAPSSTTALFMAQVRGLEVRRESASPLGAWANMDGRMGYVIIFVLWIEILLFKRRCCWQNCLKTFELFGRIRLVRLVVVGEAHLRFTYYLSITHLIFASSVFSLVWMESR